MILLQKMDADSRLGKVDEINAVEESADEWCEGDWVAMLGLDRVAMLGWPPAWESGHERRDLDWEVMLWARVAVWMSGDGGVSWNDAGVRNEAGSWNRAGGRNRGRPQKPTARIAPW